VYRIDLKTQRIHEFRGDKVTPGISEFARNLTQLADYMRPMFKGAARFIPKEQRAQTYVFIKGTAGMRLLPTETQEEIYDALIAGLQTDPHFSFQLRREDHGTISGELEGFYAVLAANYLAGRINGSLVLAPGSKGALGALDMGGGSTQVVMHSGSDDVAHLPLQMEHFQLRSFLSFGSATLRQRLFDQLTKHAVRERRLFFKTKVKDRVPNPCGFAGHEASWKGVVLVGTAEPQQCEKLVKLVAFGDENCNHETCAVDGSELFKVRGEFLAMSNYYYAMHFVHTVLPAGIPNWPRPTIEEMLRATEEVCSVPWKHASEYLRDERVLSSHPYTSPEHAPDRCLEALYVSVLLRDAFGISATERAVTFSLELNGMEVGWPLGYTIATWHRKQQKWWPHAGVASSSFNLDAWQAAVESLDYSFHSMVVSSVIALAIATALLCGSFRRRPEPVSKRRPTDCQDDSAEATPESALKT
jgi:Golgi apyrase